MKPRLLEWKCSEKGDLALGDRIILKWIILKWNITVWRGFIWFRIGIPGGLLWTE